MAWIESHETLLTHHKTARLARLLEISKVTAIGHVHVFWWWCLNNAPEGDLSGMEAADLADGGAWDGDPAAFVDAMTQAGFLEGCDESLRVHDWHDYAGKLVDKRRANAERMRDARAAKQSHPPNERATHVQRTLHALAGATVPNPTVPNPTGPELPPLPPQGERETPKTAPKPSRVTEVAALLTADGVPFAISPIDAKALKASSASPRLIADAFGAAFRGDWDPGGSGWLKDSLSFDAVVRRLSGYQAWLNSKEGGHRNGTASRQRAGFSPSHG